MKVHATQYAALVAIIGMASQLNEANAMPTSPTTLEQPMIKRGGGGSGGSEDVMEKPLLEKNLESTSATMPAPKTKTFSWTRSWKGKKPVEEEVMTPKAKLEKKLSSSSSSSPRKTLEPGEAVAMTHQLQTPTFMRMPGHL